ncbi:MAG: hypothetical protein QOC95_981 [Thermoleophilaceae bacterium]|jgi:hypothetical protein|nr:hypothetical protein [Thermoleophilaceae bacterium]
MSRLVTCLSGAVTVAALTAVSAQAAAARDLWATVNVCDTPHSPNMLGVRARMPGDGTRERMYMRFTAQYRSDGDWKPLAEGGRSGWLYAGSALFENQEIGYTFSFDAPAAGEGFLLRGLAQFQWRDRRRHLGKLRTVVVRRTHLYTAAGHPTKRAEPAGFSAATCRIQTPAA